MWEFDVLLCNDKCKINHLDGLHRVSESGHLSIGILLNAYRAPTVTQKQFAESGQHIKIVIYDIFTFCVSDLKVYFLLPTRNIQQTHFYYLFSFIYLILRIQFQCKILSHLKFGRLSATRGQQTLASLSFTLDHWRRAF